MKNPTRCSRGRVVDTFHNGDGTRSRVKFNLRFGDVSASLVAVVDTSDLDMRSDRFEARERARQSLGLPLPNDPPSMRNRNDE